jgi:hypothetical protein
LVAWGLSDAVIAWSATAQLTPSRARAAFAAPGSTRALPLRCSAAHRTRTRFRPIRVTIPSVIRAVRSSPFLRWPRCLVLGYKQPRQAHAPRSHIRDGSSDSRPGATRFSATLSSITKALASLRVRNTGPPLITTGRASLDDHPDMVAE